MKKTPLFHMHERLNARMVEFGGWLMPIQYSGIIAEHNAVRRSAGIFDLSHMGELYVEGRGALDFVQQMVTNNAAKLVDGRILYTPVCNNDGGVVDDILVYRFSSDRYMLVVNASNIDKDYAWFSEHIKKYDARIINRSDEFALIAVQGPDTLKILNSLTAIDLSAIDYYWFKEAVINDIPVIISRTGYTGEEGFELYVSSSCGEKLWEAVTQAKGAVDLLPIGIGARDSLRIEAGFSLYGNELDEKTSPLEAGLGWTIKFDKGNFIGRDRLLKQKTDSTAKRLVCFTMKESSIPRHGYELFFNDKKTGVVTSGSFSPTLKKGIGMGYIVSRDGKQAAELQVAIRGIKQAGIIVKRPFYKR